MKKILKIFKNRILAFYLISVLVFYIAVIIFSENYFSKKNISLYIENLKLTAEILSLTLENKTITPEKLDEIAKIIFNNKNIRLTFIKENGNVIADSIVDIKKINLMENHKNREEIKNAINYGKGFSIRFSTTAKKELIYYAIFKINNKENIIIRASIDFERFKDDLSLIRKNMFIFMSVTLGIFVIFGFILIKKITEPIDKIIKASKEYAKGNFSYKINIDFTGEMKKLAQTLNNMGEEIEKDLKDIEYKNRILSLIFEGMKEGILILSERDEIELFNKSFSKILSIKEDLKGKKINEVIREWEFLEAVKETKKKDIKKEIKLSSGKYIIILGFPIVLKDEKKYAFVIYDIDEEKKLEIMKRDFVANFSHEIKTPLTVIKTNLETILNEEMNSQEVKRFLSAIEKNVLRMENIVRDIIKLSYIEGNIKLEINKINIKEIIEKIIFAFEPKIKEKNIDVKIDLNQTIIQADQSLIEDCFFNLIDNAIKYNKTNGWIKIYSQKLDNEIKISIENSGNPIPNEYLERIFERFFVVDKSRSRSMGGTGLGLSIVKHIVELHKGKVYAESFKDFNRFNIILPL
jgi:two-component system phosphate regulon sensor histidine kinase PhoR